MDFFNDLGKRVSSVARSVSEKTRDSVESTRLAGDLRAQKSALDQLYAELGQLCYEIRLGRGDADQAEKVFNEIQRVHARIEELNAQRDALRDVRRCQSCGAVMPRDARYCSACGKRMPEDAPVPEAPGPADVEYCPDCGAQRVNGDPFCAVCGRSFDPAPPARPAPAPTPVPVDAEEPDGAIIGE